MTSNRTVSLEDVARRLRLRGLDATVEGDAIIVTLAGRRLSFDWADGDAKALAEKIYAAAARS
jgi:hypothetical protein